MLALREGEEPRYSKVSFDLSKAQTEDAEIPNQVKTSRRRRAQKPKPITRVPPKIGRRLLFGGTASSERATKNTIQPIQTRCLVYQGKIVTAIFELGSVEPVNPTPSTPQVVIPVAAPTAESKPTSPASENSVNNN